MAEADAKWSILVRMETDEEYGDESFSFSSWEEMDLWEMAGGFDALHEHAQRYLAGVGGGNYDIHVFDVTEPVDDPWEWLMETILDEEQWTKDRIEIERSTA